MTDTNDIGEGTTIEVGEHRYEFDGCDWTCPSWTHDSERNFDVLLDGLAKRDAEIERLRAELRREREAHTETGHMLAEYRRVTTGMARNPGD